MVSGAVAVLSSLLMLSTVPSLLFVPLLLSLVRHVCLHDADLHRSWRSEALPHRESPKLPTLGGCACLCMLPGRAHLNSSVPNHSFCWKAFCLMPDVRVRSTYRESALNVREQRPHVKPIVLRWAKDIRKRWVRTGVSHTAPSATDAVLCMYEHLKQTASLEETATRHASLTHPGSMGDPGEMVMQLLLHYDCLHQSQN